MDDRSFLVLLMRHLVQNFNTEIVLLLDEVQKFAGMTAFFAFELYNNDILEILYFSVGLLGLSVFVAFLTGPFLVNDLSLAIFNQFR